MENVTIIPALRKDRYTAGKVNVIIRVIVKRKVAKTLNTGIKIHPSHWDEDTRLVSNAEPNHQLYNTKIKREIARLESEFLKKELLGVPLTKNRVKRIAEGKDLGKDFYEFCIGKEGVVGWIKEKYTNLGTIGAYTAEIGKLKKFSPSLSFGDITHEFLTKYKTYMQKVLQNKPNTVWKTFKFINTMVRDAKKMKGLIDENPFDEFDRGTYQNPDKLGIELKDCDEIYNVAANSEQAIMLRIVASRFLLMCYSGIRFADAMRFDPSTHIINEGRIDIKTAKQGTVLNMKLNQRLKAVIELIKELPVKNMCNQEFNRWLKLLQVTSKIDIVLTSHKGRHTFGGLLAESGAPIEVARILMAHKDVSSTKIYYHVKGKNLDDAVDRFDALG